MPRLTGTCEHCGATIEFWPCQPRRFCSRACARAGGGQRQRDPSNWREYVCPTCGNLFGDWKSDPRTFCSDGCAGVATITNIRGFTPSAYEATCEQCSVTFTTTPKATRGRFCSHRCFGLWMADHAPTGPDHPNWRGGYEPYYGPSWRPARRAIRARDQVCADCGVSPAELGRALDVHHLVPFREFGVERHEEANALDNLVGLCPSCHAARDWVISPKV